MTAITWDGGATWDNGGAWDDETLSPRRILISRRDWMQDAGVVLSGGAWALPLANMIDLRPQIVAEAVTNVDWNATTFDVDLGRQRKVGVIHFQNIRATSLATIRVRAGTDPTFFSTGFDSVTVNVWPQDKTPFSVDPWGVFTGNGLMDADEFVALGMPRVFAPPTLIDVRYLRVEIKDPTAAQPLQIGCLSVCDVWEPPYNFDYGWGLTALDQSDITRVPYGSTYIVQKGRRRRLDLGFSVLPEDKVTARAMGLALVAGQSLPLIIVPFPDDVANVEKTAIRGLVSTDSQITNPYFALYAYPIQIEQLI